MPGLVNLQFHTRHIMRGNRQKTLQDKSILSIGIVVWPRSKRMKSQRLIKGAGTCVARANLKRAARRAQVTGIHGHASQQLACYAAPAMGRVDPDLQDLELPVNNPSPGIPDESVSVKGGPPRPITPGQFVHDKGLVPRVTSHDPPFKACDGARMSRIQRLVHHAVQGRTGVHDRRVTKAWTLIAANTRILDPRLQVPGIIPRQANALVFLCIGKTGVDGQGECGVMAHRIEWISRASPPRRLGGEQQALSRRCPQCLIETVSL